MGKIKKIYGMSELEKRVQRKLWRNSYHRCKNNLKKGKDEELIRQQNTPPASDAEELVFVDIYNNRLQNAAVRSSHRNAVRKLEGKVFVENKKKKGYVCKKKLINAKNRPTRGSKHFQGFKNKKNNCSPSPNSKVKDIMREGQETVKRKLNE
ncbi:unnamed protein product [Brassicogethes aeneus]|uniref:Uncharacterized protein n=1 Tax=Brassicogethes aeneus TaxID=1431903 RepID=A0A9P0B3W4_BRAAE|nr:unnamed protein product [Brassicogethes aeneus]